MTSPLRDDGRQPRAAKGIATRARAGVTDGPTGVVVDPGWLLRALLLTLGVALLCGYSTFCLLFYQGQWQIVLHPTRMAAGVTGLFSPAADKAATKVRFAPDASGQPQLTGWWLPALPTGRYRHLTVLYLPSGNGQVAQAQPVLDSLQRLGLNVFAFDYRGYGQSAGGHPDQERMMEDARSAMSYLQGSLKVAPSKTILYGAGVGGSLAVSLAASTPGVAAVVLDGPEPNLLGVALADARAKILPVRMLFKERFPLFPALATLRTPKLILTRSSVENPRISGDASTAAADPKITVALPEANEAIYAEAVSRFLDRYAPPTPVPELMPGSGAAAAAAAR